jgi:sugar/nucleoside kinase (ribokinase family)
MAQWRITSRNSSRRGRAMARAGRVGCAGELLVEFVCEGKNGRHRRADVYRGPFPSGAPGIFIDQAAQVGSDCIFVGATGDDAFGDVILDRLAAHGVDTSLIRRVNGIPTGSAFVSYNDDGSRDFVFNIAHSAATHFEADAATISALESFGLDFMHVSGSALGDPRMRQNVVGLCKALKARGVKISFDPNIRRELASDKSYFDVVRELVALSSIFLPSDDDAEALYPGRHLTDFSAELCSQGAEYVVLKRGERGAEGLSRHGEHLRIDAHKVEARDPTGAGDCFCGTFVGLIAGGDFTFEEAMQRANGAGALAVTQVGPMEGNSTRPVIESFLRRIR